MIWFCTFAFLSTRLRLLSAWLPPNVDGLHLQKASFEMISSTHIRMHYVWPIILAVALGPVCGCGNDQEEHVLGGYVVLEDDTPVEGIEVVFLWPHWLGDWEAVETTDSTGWYGYKSEGRHPENRVTVTPRYESYGFSPAYYDLRDIRDANREDLDFLATPKDLAKILD